MNNLKKFEMFIYDMEKYFNKGDLELVFRDRFALRENWSSYNLQINKKALSLKKGYDETALINYLISDEVQIKESDILSFSQNGVSINCFLINKIMEELNQSEEFYKNYLFDYMLYSYLQLMIRTLAEECGCSSDCRMKNGCKLLQTIHLIANAKIIHNPLRSEMTSIIDKANVAIKNWIYNL